MVCGRSLMLVVPVEADAPPCRIPVSTASSKRTGGVAGSLRPGGLRMSGRQHDPLAEAIPEALGQAKSRWGHEGHVLLEYPGPPERCLVGGAAGHGMRVYGRGKAWDEAFADADARGGVAFVRNISPF